MYLVCNTCVIIFLKNEKIIKLGKLKAQAAILGNKNQMHRYRMGLTWLIKSTYEIDFGIKVNYELNMN